MPPSAMRRSESGKDEPYGGPCAFPELHQWPVARKRFWPLVIGRFLGGTAAAIPLSWGLLRPRATANQIRLSALALSLVMAMVAAGLLVGFGSVWGNGCTSGHGVCGLSRLSIRSVVATAIFMATAFVTVFLVRHVIGG